MNDRFLWFLRILVVIQCLGYAAKLVGPSSLNSFLLGSMGDSFVTNLDRSVQLFLCALAESSLLSAFEAPVRSWSRRLDFAILGLIAGWSFVLAVFSWLNNAGNAFHATDPIGHAVRFAAPFALILFTAFPGRDQESRIEWVLRWGVAGAFTGHGLSPCG